MDQDGNLIALGGFGEVTGSGGITSFRGAGGYRDDIADGYLLATVHLKKGASISEPSTKPSPPNLPVAEEQCACRSDLTSPLLHP